MPPLPQRIDNALNTAGKAMTLLERVVAGLGLGDPKKRALLLRQRAVRQRKLALRAHNTRAGERHFANAKALDERADLLDPPVPTVCVDG